MLARNITYTLSMLLLLLFPLTALAKNNENAIQIIQGLRKQMKELQTIRTNYSVEFLDSSTKTKATHEMLYLKDLKSGKFNISQNSVRGIDNSKVEQRLVYNGSCVKKFDTDEYDKDRPYPKTGSIRHGRYHSQFIHTNDPLKSIGYTILSPMWEKAIPTFEFKDLGTETIDGHECRKILQISPYRGGPKKSYTYWWIDLTDSKYKLRKNTSSIDNDPDLLTYEMTFKYENSGSFPFPSEVEYKRLKIDRKNWNTAPEYKKKIVFNKVQINAPIADAEFEYEFPYGTFVEDHIIGTSLVVGKTLDIDDILSDISLGKTKEASIEIESHTDTMRRGNDSEVPVSESQVDVNTKGILKKQAKSINKFSLWLLAAIGSLVLLLLSIFYKNGKDSLENQD